MTLEIRTADELIDPEVESRWATRRAARQTDVLQSILRAFVDRGGPVSVDDLVTAFPGQAPDAVRDALVMLDADDLIRVREGRVDIAYPFSAAPTPFVVRLDGDRERYACCAIDALGIAPMLGERIDIESPCHHCGTPLALSVDSEGPGPDAAEIMIWVGKQADGERRIATSL